MFAFEDTEKDINFNTALLYLAIGIICSVLYTVFKWPCHDMCLNDHQYMLTDVATELSTANLTRDKNRKYFKLI